MNITYKPAKKIIIVFLFICLFVSLFLSGFLFIKEKHVAASTLNESETLSSNWNTYKNLASTDYDNIKVVELNDFIAEGFRATGETEWGDIVETSWTYSDAIELIGGENALVDSYVFLISNARELMYFSYFASGKHPSVNSMQNLAQVQQLFLESNFMLGNNIYYDGRTYFYKNGTETQSCETNANYSGADKAFLPVSDFEGIFDGQGFEIINLTIDAYTYVSDTNYLYSSMFVKSIGQIKNLGLLNCEINLNGSSATNLSVVMDYSESGSTIENVYAVNTLVSNITGSGSLNLNLFDAVAFGAEYYLTGSHTDNLQITLTQQTSDFDTTTKDSNGDLIWYGESCYAYNEDLTDFVSYREDGKTVYEYNYYKLSGIRNFDSTVIKAVSNVYPSGTYKAHFTSYEDHNYGIFKPADLVCFIDSVYHYSIYMTGVIRHDLELKTITRYAYFPIEVNGNNAGLIGYKKLTTNETISQEIIIDIDDNNLTYSFNDQSRAVDIFNFNNYTYRLSRADSSAYMCGLFESVNSNTLMADINFVSGYLMMSEKAMNFAYIERDEEGKVTSVTNQSDKNYYYNIGLLARADNDSIFSNIYSNLDVSLEDGKFNLIYGVYMGGLIGSQYVNGTNQFNIVHNTVISGNITGGKACTYANTSNIYVGGLVGYYRNSIRSYYYNRFVFSGNVTGFKPSYSDSDAQVYAYSYTGGFTGRMNTYNAYGYKLSSGVLVSGNVYTLPRENDTEYYDYRNCTIYTGGLVGYDNAEDSMMTGGFFRFSGKLSIVSYYSDNYERGRIYINTGLYAGRMTRDINLNSTYSAKSDGTSDYDLITGGYSSDYTEDGQTFISTSQDNIKLNNENVRFYTSIFIGYSGGNKREKMHNYIPVTISGECYQFYFHSIASNSDIISNCLNDGDITVNNLYASSSTYISGLIGTFSSNGVYQNCTNNGDITISNILNSSVNVAGIVRYIYDNATIDNFVNTGNITLENIENNIYGGGICTEVRYNTILNNSQNSGIISVSDCSGSYLRIGGIGYQVWDNSQVINCMNNGDILIDELTNYSYINAGGILGYAEVGGNIDNCINNADITIDYDFSNVSKDNRMYIGGILGYSRYCYDGFKILNSLNSGNISLVPVSAIYEQNRLLEFNAGGIIGYSDSRVIDISDSVNTGDIDVKKYNNSVVNILTDRLFTRLGGIIGYVFDYNDTSKYSIKMQSVINYGNITNGYTCGGIAGSISNIDNGVYINGAVNFGEIYSENILTSVYEWNYYSAGNGGIIGYLSSEDACLYNVINNGRVKDISDDFNLSGGIIGNYSVGDNSYSSRANLTRDAGEVTDFCGVLYIKNNKISTDRIIGNILLDNSFCQSQDIAMAVSENAGLTYDTGAEIYYINDSDTNGIYGSSFFWSIENEKTYETVKVKNYAYDSSSHTLLIEEVYEKAVSTPQIVFSNKASYGNISFDSQGQFSFDSTEVNQARGHYISDTEYIFALTTSAGRREGIYLGENIQSLTESQSDYLKQIDLSRDNFINNYAYNDGNVTNITVTDKLNSLDFESAMVSEKLEQDKDDSIFITVLNHGEYINAAEGISYTEFTAFTGANPNFIINAGESIFSDKSSYKITDFDNSNMTVNFDIADPDWNIVSCIAKIKVWQGDTEPADDSVFCKFYNFYIFFIDIENSLEFVNLDAEGNIFDKTSSGYYYDGDDITKTHYFQNDIIINSLADFNMVINFTADGVPNNTSGRIAELKINNGGNYESISEDFWSYSSSYTTNNESGDFQELQNLLDILGENEIYLRSDIQFNLSFNRNFTDSINELQAGDYSLTLKIYKGRENGTDIFYEHTFNLIKQISTDNNLHHFGETQTSSVTTYFINGQTGENQTLTTNYSISNVNNVLVYTVNYNFGFLPDLNLFTQSADALDIFAGGINKPLYSEVSKPQSVTLTKNEYGTHIVSFTFTVTSESGEEQLYEFVFNESNPTLSYVSLTRDGVRLTGRTDDIARGSAPAYLSEYSGLNSKTELMPLGYILYLDDVDVYGLSDVIPPEISVYGDNAYNIIFSNDPNSTTTGGLWKFIPYLQLKNEADFSLSYYLDGETTQVTAETIWKEWKNLISQNSEILLNKTTSRLCYAEDIGISNSHLGVLSYYGTTNSTFEEDSGLIGQGTSLIDGYRKYSYDYGSLNTDLSGSLMSKYRVKNFVNYLTIGDDEDTGDYFYSTYLIISIKKSTEENLAFNDGFTKVKYKIVGDDSTVPDYVDMQILDYDDPDYSYYIFWMDESISVPTGSASSGLSLRVRLVAENTMYYTDYDFIFRTPLKNKNIEMNVSFDTSGGMNDVWQNDYANIGIKTGFYNSETGVVTFTRSTNLLFLMDKYYNPSLVKDTSIIYHNFIAEDTGGGVYSNSYNMINYPATRYYFFCDLPEGYILDITGIKIKIGGVYTEIITENYFNQSENLYEWERYDFNEWIYIPADKSYVELGGVSPSDILIEAEIKQSVNINPPPWGVEI